MWARRSRSLLRVVSPRKARSSRSLNGQAQIPHTTYFNPPPKPPRRVWRSLLLGTTLVAAGAYTHAWLFDLPLLPGDFLGEGLGEDAAEDELMEAMNNPVVGKEMLFALTNKIAAESVLPVDLPTAEVFLNEMAGCAFSPRAVAHICQLPSVRNPLLRSLIADSTSQIESAMRRQSRIEPLRRRPRSTGFLANLVDSGRSCRASHCELPRSSPIRCCGRRTRESKLLGTAIYTQ